MPAASSTPLQMQDLFPRLLAKEPSSGNGFGRDRVRRHFGCSGGSARRAEGGHKELADFVEAKEPRILAYNVYFSDDGARMTVVHVHPDAASLEYHLEVARPVFRRFVGSVTLSSIHIYGEPSEKVLEQAHEKARLLGQGEVVADAFHAGFTRFAAG
jgi:hypothetical protein